MVKPGGLHDATPADAECSTAVNAIKSELESKTGKTYELFEPISYAKQTVAGVNYFVKVKVPSGFIHVRIFKDLQQNYSFHSLQEGKSLESAIEHF
eukprot:gene12261-14371_t